MLPHARRRRATRHPSDEGGAVVVLTALMLVALFGMLALVVDVGGMLYRRIELQKAADAAALAAAISCGNHEGAPAAGLQADQLTIANSAEGAVAPGWPSYSPNCDASSGTVTVRVRASQDVWFGAVLGLDGPVEVTAKATALWGGAGVGEHIAPLMLSADRLNDCDIPPDGEVVEKVCAFWWDNSPASSDDPALSASEWGTLDLLKWDVLPSTQCDNSTPPQFEEWMYEGFDGPLPVNNLDPETGIDPPTYVCRGQGNFGAALDNLIDDAIGQDPPYFLYFPVNDPRGQIDANGDPCVPPDLMDDPTLYDGCTVDKYDIIGFARLEIIGLYKKQDDETVDLCTSRITGAEPTANSRCMLARWVDYTNEGLNPEGGENFGLVPVTLVG
jgi:Flp pilus assembly protein TadG